MAAQDAQLLLKVGLDLSTFRAQLATLGQEASGIVIGFDRTAAQQELNLLGANIRKRTYRLNVETNIKAEIENAKILATALADLGRAGQQVQGAAGRAASGGVNTVDASKFQAMVNRATKPALEALYQGMAKAEVPMAEVGGRTVDELKKSIISGIPGITQDIARGMAKGLEGLKESGRKGAKFVIDSFKDAAGIASPSRVFKQLGQFSAEGLEDGFLEGLRDFKGKAVSEIRKIVALMRFEFAKVQDLSGMGGASAGNLRQQLVGSRAYTSPIGPLPHGSRQPWAANEQGGYDPRMVSRLRGQQYPAASGSFLEFSRAASQPFPPSGTPGTFLGFSQRASQISAGGGSGGGKGPGGPPPVPPGGGGGGFGGFGGFGREFNKAMSTTGLPGSGMIREIGSEFAFATKQVLLFGQAYKLLGFAQDFPAQVAQAVGELQSFRNTLKAISPTAQEVSASNEFIMNVVDKYNVPLESARAGFTRLYASMEPAGFKGDEIRNLFLGISKAAATFGMSSDKVDRVMYAFAQMASKGQVMSEELKGQLGDVLPGALGIFAKAAGFEGPQAIEKFSKALEDGAFKGDSMRKLLKNVSFDLNKEFGPGAEGAARTYQGVMNRMQNSTKLFYESFEPLAVAFANDLIIPVSQGLRNIADGVKAYTTGSKPATEEAENFAAMLRNMAPTLEGIRNNIGLVGTSLLETGRVLGFVTLQFTQLLGLPIVGQLAAGYASVLLLSGAFKLLGGQALITTIASLIQFGVQSTAAIGLTNSLSTSTLAYRLAAIQAAAATTQFGNTLNIVMARTVIGVALVALGALIGKIVEVRSQMAAIGGDAKGMEEAARISAKFGDVLGTKEQLGNIKARANTFKQLKQQIEELGDIKTGNSVIVTSDRDVINDSLQLSTALGNKLVELGLIQQSQLTKNNSGYKVLKTTLDSVGGLIDSNIASFEKASSKENKYIQEAERNRRKLADRQKVDLATGDDTAAARAAEDARKLADDRRKYEADLMKLNAQEAIELDSMYFEQWKTLQDKKFDYMDAGQNEYMKREIKFQRDLQAIELRRVEAVFRAQSASRKAAIDAESAAYAAGSTLGGGATGATGLLQGSTGISSGPHFDVRRADGSRMTEAEARALFSAEVRRQLTMTSGYGPRNTGIPGASTFHRGIDLAGPKNTPLNLAPGYSLQSAGMQGGLGYTANVKGPRGEIYQVGHLQQPSGKLPASRIRKEAKQDYSADLAAQEAINVKQREAVSILHANEQAQKEINILIREYVASIAPVEQQKLENNLLQDRINLIVGGLSGEALDAEIAISRVRKQSALGIEQARKEITEYEGKVKEVNQALKDKKITTEQAAASIFSYSNIIASNERKIKNLTTATEEYLPLLREQLRLAQQAAEVELRGSITRATPLGGTGLAGGFIGDAGAKFEEALSRGASREDATRFAELQNQLTLLETRNGAIKSSILAIGDAFGTAMTTGVASLVDGTASAEEVFANFLSSVGQALIQAAQQMIATYIAIGIARIFAGLGGAMGGGNTGTAAGGLPGSKLEGGFANPLVGLYAGANGGIAAGGWEPFPVTPFANGGMVTGPTLGLVGEGKYNEAIVPLPDGRSIPVQLQDSSIRDKMEGGAGSMSAMPMLSMSFQSTTINGVEYVDRAQLEAAMAETRKISVREGATRGATIALDKLANSPSSRRRVGLR